MTSSARDTWGWDRHLPDCRWRGWVRMGRSEGWLRSFDHHRVTWGLHIFYVSKKCRGIVCRDYPLCLKVEKEIRPSGDLTCDRKQDWWTWILQPQQQWPRLPRGTRRSDQLLTSQWTRHSCRRSLIRFMRSRPLGSSRSFHQKEWKRLGAKNEPLASEKIAENVFIVKIWRDTVDLEDSSRNVCINKLKS